jgi:hypothetical protein
MPKDYKAQRLYMKLNSALKQQRNSRDKNILKNLPLKIQKIKQEIRQHFSSPL